MSVSINPTVVKLSRSQSDAAIDVLAHSFYTDPVFRYFWSEQDSALFKTLQWFIKILLRYSQPYEHIYTTADLQGIAMWIPPGKYPLNDLRLLQLGFYALPFKLQWRKSLQFLAAFSKIEKLHRGDMPQPHWYLFLLGVAPESQGQGIGGLLIEPILNQADLEKLPCYVETSTERGVRFYQKYGFETVHTVYFESAPPYWLMKRMPQQ